MVCTYTHKSLLIVQDLFKRFYFVYSFGHLLLVGVGSTYNKAEKSISLIYFLRHHLQFNEIRMRIAYSFKRRKKYISFMR